MFSIIPTHPEDWEHPILLFLIGCIILLLLITVGLVILTVSLHRANTKKARFWQELEARWEPLLNKVIANMLPAEEVYSQVKPQEIFYFIDFLMRYAQRLSGQALDRVRELAAPYLPRLAKKAEDGDEEQRARAIWTLSALGPETYRPIMVRALNDPAPVVNMLAARSLADSHGIEYLPQILNRLERFRAWSPNYLTSMLVALAQNNPEKLHHALETPQPDWVKVLILKSLTELNDSQALGRAALILSVDESPEVLSAALQLITKLGNSQYKALVRMCCDHSDFGVRLNALKAMHRIGNTSDAPLLRSCLDDPSQWIAREAAAGLREIGALDILESIANSEHPRASLAQQMLQDWDSDKILATAVQSTSFLPHIPDWLSNATRRPRGEGWRQLQRILNHPDIHPDVRSGLIAQLPAEATRFLAPELHSQLISSPLSAQAWMIEALAKLEAGYAWPALQRLFFQTPNADVQAAIIKLKATLSSDLQEAFVQQWFRLSTAQRKLFSEHTQTHLMHQDPSSLKLPRS